MTGYNATVANANASAALEAQLNDANATVEFLDKDDATITSVFASGIHSIQPNLDVGNNVFKVKVTAEDASTTKTYTVTVRRAAADDLVSNLGQVKVGGHAVDDTELGVAVQFTAGNETGGYTIGKVRLNLSATSGTIPTVSIYSDGSGRAGSSLKVLTNPSNIPTTSTELDFDAGDYLLDPNTSYWIVTEAPTGSGVFIGVGVTLPPTRKTPARRRAGALATNHHS